ncbi:MAG: hypothetical protein Q4P28_04090 [Tissierellia bacterium]|nr:hypothetical protein [Tissierellia bacterium]
MSQGIQELLEELNGKYHQLILVVIHNRCIEGVATDPLKFKMV